MAWPRRALVVVHGIGAQPRGATRDAFVSALEDLGATDLGYQRGDPVAFDESPPAVARRIRSDTVEADVYEVYWAPQTSHKTTARSVLLWMIRNTFLPGTALRRPSRKTRLDVLQIVLLGAIALYVLLLSLTTLGNLSAEASCATDPKPPCPPATRTYEPAALTGARITWGWSSQLTDTVRTLGRAVRPTDRPLDDLTPSHASAV